MKRGRGKRKQVNSDEAWAKWGGYNNCKLKKLSDLEYGSLQSNIFNGVSIYVNGYTEPNAIELHKLIKTNGGIFLPFYSKRLVTHIIASNLALSKILKLTANEKVVKASWITESLKLGKLLPIDEFRLYNKDNQQTLLTKLYKDEPRDIGEHNIAVKNMISEKDFISDSKKSLNSIDFNEDFFISNDFNSNINDKDKFHCNFSLYLNDENKPVINNLKPLIALKNNSYLMNDGNIILSSNISLSDEDMFLDQNINNDNKIIHEIEVKPNFGDVFIPSQIDQEVLNELPIELQNEIKQQISKNKLNDFQKNIFTNVVPPINKLHLENNKKILPNKVLGIKKNKVNLNKSPLKTKAKLIKKNKNNFMKRPINSDYNVDSFSQIDENVFKTLPEEIKIEIRQQLEQKKLSHKKNSLILKSSNQNKFKKYLNNDLEYYQDVCKTTEVDLNGRIDLDEVKQYIKEWIQSTDEPLEEDIEVLNEYFVKLLENAQLDFIYWISKYMLRLALKEIAWANRIHKLIENVQNNVIIVYGNPLKLAY